MKETKAVEEEVQNFIDDVSRSTTRRLGRGSVLLQRGCFDSEAEMQKEREEHPARIAKLKAFFDL